MDEMYTQCLLQSGQRMTTGWIPTTAARRGHRVTLPDLDETVWTVVEVYTLCIPAATMVQHARDYKDFQGSTKGGGIDH